MSRRAVAHARRRRSADHAIDWTMMPGTAHQVCAEWDECRYDDVLRPALRVRATLVLDEHGEPAELTDIVPDRPLS